jgi:hypothetical protein
MTMKLRSSVGRAGWRWEMAQITKAVAIANNKVVYLVWGINATAISGCRGFHIVREYFDAPDQVTEEQPLASYVAFRGPCNPDWLADNFSYKASYSNDDNLIIVEGHAALAQAYAVHVLEVYDRCRFRAAEGELTAQCRRRGAAIGQSDPRWDGFLGSREGWQACARTACRPISRDVNAEWPARPSVSGLLRDVVLEEFNCAREKTRARQIQAGRVILAGSTAISI